MFPARMSFIYFERYTALAIGSVVKYNTAFLFFMEVRKTISFGWKTSRKRMFYLAKCQRENIKVFSDKCLMQYKLDWVSLVDIYG